MSSSFTRNIRPGAVILTLALPGWSAEATKTLTPPVKEETLGTSQEIKHFQKTLYEYGPRVIDEIMSQRTPASLKEFQKAKDGEDTGISDSKTAQKLGVIAQTSGSDEPGKPGGTQGAAPGEKEDIARATIEGVITKVQQEGRAFTVKSKDGKETSVNIYGGPTTIVGVKNPSDLKVGQKVTVEYDKGGAKKVVVAK